MKGSFEVPEEKSENKAENVSEFSTESIHSIDDMCQIVDAVKALLPLVREAAASAGLELGEARDSISINDFRFKKGVNGYHDITLDVNKILSSSQWEGTGVIIPDNVIREEDREHGVALCKILEIITKEPYTTWHNNDVGNSNGVGVELEDGKLVYKGFNPSKKDFIDIRISEEWKAGRMKEGSFKPYDGEWETKEGNNEEKVLAAKELLAVKSGGKS